MKNAGAMNFYAVIMTGGEMTNNEINRIIAEYIDEWIEQIHLPHSNGNYWVKVMDDDMPKLEQPPYISSLDSLVPVWEKLRSDRNGFRESFRLTIFKDSCVADHTREIGIENLCEGKTIQQAAAHATAKAIQELTK